MGQNSGLIHMSSISFYCCGLEQRIIVVTKHVLKVPHALRSVMSF